MLLEDGEVDAGSAADFEAFLDRCSHIDITAPDGTTGSLDLRPLELPEVGDVSQGVAFTVTVGTPDGTGAAVNALMAVAVEGQRMVFLLAGGHRRCRARRGGVQRPVRAGLRGAGGHLARSRAGPRRRRPGPARPR